MKNIQLYKCVLERAGLLRLEESVPTLATHAEAAKTILTALLADSPSEKVYVLMLNARKAVVGAELISMGGQTQTSVAVREVFRAAIIQNANAIILGHNHPSGDSTPSSEDIHMTHAIVKASKLLGIELLDHLIITPSGSWSSVFDHCLFER